MNEFIYLNTKILLSQFRCDLFFSCWYLIEMNLGIIFVIPPSQPDAEFLAIRADADGCIQIYARVGEISRFSRLSNFQWIQRQFGSQHRLAVSKICSIVDFQWHNLTIEKGPRRMEAYLNGELAATITMVSNLS